MRGERDTYNEPCEVPSFALVAACYASLSDELVYEWIDDRGCDRLCQLEVEKEEKLQFGERCLLYVSAVVFCR